MATNAVLIANPTPASITVNGVTVASNKVVVAPAVSDAVTDLSVFVAKGCVVAPASLTNGSGNVTDVLDNATTLVEKGARLLGSLVRAVNSAGSDTRAQAGV
jgi:hypothetical protein